MKFKALFEKATGRPPYPYQEAFATAPDLPHLLEVPTGAGKTATAVLGWLWRRIHGSPEIKAGTGRRLVFCLPMRSLVDQTHRVTEEWLSRLDLSERISLHKLMGGAIARDWDETPEEDSILIGTQDQLLSRALNRGYAMSRFRWPIHFGWLNSDCLWVMDEVQLMGSGLSTSAQLHGLRQKLGTFGPTHTVWMSATLEKGSLATVDLRGIDLRLQSLEEPDKAALALRLNAKKPIEALAADPKKPMALARRVSELHRPESLTLVVLNRVRRARELTAALNKVVEGVDVELIHSRFRPYERNAAQTRALQPGWAGILVATQAIEAGVDIDARVMITDLASWPSLVQRFGRCNRAGEYDDTRVLWLDVAAKNAAPYDAEDLERARARLVSLDDVGPATLAGVATDEVRPALPILRRTDLLSLFDTQSDLAGHDIDVSGFVRATEADRDVQVLWRVWEGPRPPNETFAPHRDELCRAPAQEVKSLLGKGGGAWRWSSLHRRWEPLRESELHPGLTILLHAKCGGYSPMLGWTGDRDDVPDPVPPPADRIENDYDEGDPLTLSTHRYVELATHSSDVVAEVDALVAAIGGTVPWDAVRTAARWHDLGKAHAEFQKMLTDKLDVDDPRRDKVWAKSDMVHSGACERRHFRHELASAIAFMDQGGKTLEIYLVAAHHGKVRMAIRARPTESGPPADPDRLFALGVWDGDTLPEVDLGDGIISRSQALSLKAMLVGRQEGAPSWTERSLGLLDGLGPFKLAYLEGLLRIADWRATRKRMEDADG